MPDLKPVYDQLTAPGSPFELGSETVLGEPMQVLLKRPGSLRELLAASAGFEDREFLIFGDRRISYAEHVRSVAQLARALETQFGIRAGDRVAILGANSPEWILTFWAVTSLGAIAVAMNGWWAAGEILHALEDSDPKLLVADAKRLSRLGGESLSVPTVDLETEIPALCSGSGELPATPIDEDAPAVILYTSGTTGRAKGAVLSHRSLVASVGLQTLHGAAMLVSSGAAPPSTPPCTLLTTPLFHVSGLNAGVVMMMSIGAKVVLREGRFDPLDVMRLIETERVTSWSSTPTMAHRVVNHPEFGTHDLSSLTSLGSGGSALSESLQEAMRKAVPSAARGLGLGYGLTESGGIATINSGEDLECQPKSSGRAMPCVSVEIRDASGSPVADGVDGEIFVRSPLVMLGYWRNESATQESLGAGRWLRTGDVGRLEDGHLFINSRARDLIIRGGENVYPTEVEQVLEAHPDVDEAAVVGVDHEELGQDIAAFVVPRPGANLDEGSLREWSRDHIATFKVPAVWHFMQQPLPRNASGKVLKPQLLGEASRLVEE
jgi:acyl-CoA synthetase (AMP-forming)/AMP-acid ligase II